MEGTRQEIPQWIWYNAQFAFKFQETLEKCPDKSLREFWSYFKKDQNLENLQDFHLKNQGMVLTLMYGLLVVPKEMWGTEKLDKNFKFETKKELKITQPNHPISNSEIIKYMRNSVSHANFEIYSGLNQYVFWNKNKDGQRNFECIVSHESLGKFLTEIGKFYINEVRN